jgi:hypothetical protein
MAPPSSNPTRPVEPGRWHSLWFIPLVWAGLVFARYFSSIGHPFPFVLSVFDASSFPPVPVSQALKVWEESLFILFTSFLIPLVTCALGRRVRHWLSLEMRDPWLRAATDFGLGIVFLNLFWMGTGFNRIWYKPMWFSAAILFCLLLIFDFIQSSRRNPWKNRPSLFPADLNYLAIFLVGIFYWIFSILQNLAPETFYDSMVYHLAVPHYWLFQHGLADFPTNFFSNYPFGGELYFLNGLVFQGTETAKMLHVISFGFCALAAGGWAREISGDKAGWLVLSLTLTLPLFAVNTWTTQIEGLLALSLVLFLYALNQFARMDGRGALWALLAGLFAGLALSSKYTGFLVTGSALVVLAFQRILVFRKSQWKYWPVILSAALLLLGPWIVKNLLYTGNPFFPYFMSYFPGRHLSLMGYERLLQEQHSRVTTDWWSWLLLPWTLTMANPDSYNFCGPVPLALAPFIFLFRLRHPVLRFLALLTPLVFISGMAVTHILRFIGADFVLIYILAGAALAGLEKPVWGRAVSWIGAFSALLCFAYLAAMSHYYYSCSGIWWGRQTRAEYLSNPAKLTPYYPVAQWISANLPPDARLLVVGDARGLYYDRPFFTNTVFDEQVLAQLAKKESDPEGIGHRLREMGVNYLVMNALEGIRVSSDYHHYDLTSEEWKRLDDFIQRGTILVYGKNLQCVYHVMPSLWERPQRDIPDLALYFSQPASKYVLDRQKHNAAEAQQDMDEAAKLYPFSLFWKEQQAEFEKSLNDS